MGVKEEGPVRLNEAGRLMCLALGLGLHWGATEAPSNGQFLGRGSWAALPIQLLPCTQETQLYLGVKQTKSNF